MRSWRSRSTRADDERLAEGHLLLANALLESGSAAFEPALDESLRVCDRLGAQAHLATSTLVPMGRLAAARDRSPA